MAEGNRRDDNLGSVDTTDETTPQVDPKDTFSPQGVPSSIGGDIRETRGQAEERKLAEARGEKTPKGQDLPGGLAPVAKTPRNVPRPEAPQTAPAQEGLGGRIASGGRQLFNKGVDAGKKAWDKLKKEGFKKIAAALVRSPYFWIAVAILIVLGIIILAFSDASDKDVSAGGKSTPRMVDPVSDKAWIQKVLLLAGDKNVSSFLAKDYLAGLTSDLTLLSSQTTNPAVRAQAEKILQDITTLKAASNDTDKKAKAQIVLADMNALGVLIFDVAPLPTTIATSYPVEKSLLAENTFNPDTRMGTPAYPCGGTTGVDCKKTKGHAGAPLMQPGENTCDATDIILPKSSVPEDTPVYPLFGGTVIEKTDKFVKIELVEGGHTYDALYVGATSGLAKGATVRVVAGNLAETTKIGTIGASRHLHLELSIDNQCVVATPLEASTAINANKYVGYIVWQKMMKALNLT